jgi:aspartate/methionine/tyrosine aminotransferase
VAHPALLASAAPVFTAAPPRRRLPLATRMAYIEPFHVMSMMVRAGALEAQGRSITYMVIGEPDFSTAEPIVQAGIESLQAGKTHYAPDLGLAALRAAIARSYAPGLKIDPEQVVVTPGSSGALQLIFAALLSPGDEVLLTDPGYPCNRHFVRLFEGVPVNIPVNASTSYQLTADLIRRHWTPRTVAVAVGSPSNPVGSVIPDDEMDRIVRTVDELGGILIVDEIYHGLVYSAALSSVAGKSSRVFVVNSFSKYYGMTGWRVGWLVGPREYISAIERLVQNIFIAASTPAQYAALEALKPVARVELERRRQVFRERRDYLLPALRAIGFDIPVEPQGAFYVYADCSRFTSDSQSFVLALLEEAGVAVAPGLDFGVYKRERHVRFSYANSLEDLQEGVRRIAAFLAGSKSLRMRVEAQPLTGPVRVRPPTVAVAATSACAAES